MALAGIAPSFAGMATEFECCPIFAPRLRPRPTGVGSMLASVIARYFVRVVDTKSLTYGVF